MRSTGPSAAIAAIMPGIQAHGFWAGYRQLFVRFAAEGETATLYSPEMLARAVERGMQGGGLHSISLAGRDPAGCASFIAQAWRSRPPESSATLPVMLDTDGRRPEAIAELGPILALVQVTVTLTESREVIEKILATLSASEQARVAHAVVVVPPAAGSAATIAVASDGALARFVEEVKRASAGTKIVVHPPEGAERAPLDRRFSAMFEQAAAASSDVRVMMRIPSPVGVR